MYTIRKATKDDINAIQELNAKLFKKEFEEFDPSLNCDWPMSKEGKAYFLERIEGKDACALIALLEDEPIGYLVGSITETASYRSAQKTATLENMYVEAEHRSKKLGTQLFAKFQQWCEANGVARISVTTSAENEKAINFYMNKGFEPYDITFEKQVK